MKFSPMAALTESAVGDENIAKMMTFSFQLIV